MNRIERMNAVITGKPVDRIPVGMWYHFDPKLSAEEAADAHFNFVRSVDLDLIKIMYDNGYVLDQKIQKPSDWYTIKPLGKSSPFYCKQRDILRRLIDKGAGEYPIWITMFGAFKFAVMATSDALVMEHSRVDPDAVCSGVSAIANSLCEWAEGYLAEGADAIFYSAQFGEVGRFSKDEWRRLVRPYDLRVLSVAEQMKNKYNVLHLCGEPEYGFRVHLDRFADYPGALVNWAIYPNGYELERGTDLFERPVMGGLDNHGVMAYGTEEEVAAKVRELIDHYGKQGFMLGADCSIESPACAGRIKAAVLAAQQY